MNRVIVLVAVQLLASCCRIEDTVNYAYVRLACQLNKHASRYMTAYEINQKLTHRVDGHTYKLVPMYNCRSHYLNYLELLVKQNRKYMKYYRTSEQQNKQVFKRLVNRRVSGICFLSMLDGKLAGYINIGHSTIKNTLEVGYITKAGMEGKKVASISLKMAANFIKFLQERGMMKSAYGLFATCHPQNIASGKVLGNNGFSYITYCLRKNRYYYLRKL